MFYARLFAAVGLVGAFSVSGIGLADANAQQIFRIVGPDGRVTFSDKPPVEPNAKAQAAAVASASGGGTASLPFELRQAATRYPVTLYTSPGCSSCAAGRSLLSSRGIPFAEKTVVSNDDIEALKRFTGAATVPLLTIGGQQIKGFADGEWAQYLDAAGYPKTSQLPPGYSPAPATPMVAAQQPQQPQRAPQGTAEASNVPPPPPAATADNPAGIKF
jgi:glutaredoxin